MDLLGKNILAFLEEDNRERMLFHVRPLLTEDGVISKADAETAFPDNGFVRIVPDKNEQYTFKERMSRMSSLCLINLKDFPADANKVRPNRNYMPGRSEEHQFIIYSNAVQDLPKEMVFEVISGKEPKDMPGCGTPAYYLRNGGRIQGPYLSETGAECAENTVIAPDSARLFSVQFENGQERLFYWPEPKPEPEPEPLSAKELIQQLDEALPQLGNTLKDTVAFRVPDIAKEAPQKPLRGTPIFTPAVKPVREKRGFNALSAVVDRQSQAHRLGPIGAEVQDGAPMQDIQSPVAVFEEAMTKVWHGEDMRERAIRFMMALPGASPLLARALSRGEENNAVLSAMKAQLQDMEAERLSLMMQLDKARENMAQLKETALSECEDGRKKALEDLRRAVAEGETLLNSLNAELPRLLKEKEQLALDITRMLGRPAPLVPPQGEEADRSEIVRRMRECLMAAGFAAAKDDALHLLLLLGVSAQVQIFAPALPDAVQAAKSICAALGAPMANALENPACFAACPGGTGMAAALLPEGTAQESACLQLIPASSLRPVSTGAGYRFAPWPVAELTAADGAEKPLPVFPALSKDSLEALLAKAEPLSGEAEGLLAKTARAFDQAGAPLSRALLNKTRAYLRAAQSLMDGGIAAALGRGFRAFLLPHALYYQLDEAVIDRIMASLRCAAK